MEVSKTEIQKIEKYLKSKKVDYLDLKLEIADHMISDIEQLMQNGFSFDNAFTRVQLKWNRYFRKRSSFFFGMQYSAPKVVLTKAVAEFKVFYFLYFLSYFIPLILFKKVMIRLPETVLNVLPFIIKPFVVCALLYTLYIMYKTYQLNVKTTYQFILKTQFLGVLLFILPLFIDQYTNKDGTISGIIIGLLFASFVNVAIIHHFYKKHICEIKKFKRFV